MKGQTTNCGSVMLSLTFLAFWERTHHLIVTDAAPANLSLSRLYLSIKPFVNT